SISGLMAKPIIDINIGVRSLEVVEEMKEKFKELGYEHRILDPNRMKKENRKKIEEQELFVKGLESKRTHHVHVTIYNSDFWKKDLLFRDHIANNPLRAKEYAKLKKSLAKKYPKDIIKYSSGKDPFITKTLKLCLKSDLSHD
ncbi:GrpB family protein, partial [Patescibacteria group bacterium]|nr:GrpB family protein [Patescibacteria group bacterium]